MARVRPTRRPPSNNTSGRFQWAWDIANSYLPAAHASILYSPTGITFDASGSTPGLNSYGTNTFVGFGWDLDGNGTVDLSGGNQIYVSYDDLKNVYDLSPGEHTAVLQVSVVNELGQIVSSESSTTTFYVPEPAALILLATGAAKQLLVSIKSRRNGRAAARPVAQSD